MLKNFIDYLKSRYIYILLNIIVMMIVIYVYSFKIIALRLAVFIILIIFVLVLINILTTYFTFYKTHKQLECYCKDVEQKFLVTKLISNPDFQTKKYLKIIYTIVSDEHQKTIIAEQNLNEYKEQAIKWIHKTKQHINILENNIDKSDIESLQALTVLKNSIDNLLFIQKLDNFSQTVVLKKYNLHDLIIEIFIKNRYILKDLKVNIDIDDQFNLLTDKYFFKEAIEQLISNTVKYNSKNLTIKLINNKLIYSNDSKPIPETEKKYLFLRGITSSRIENATGYGLYYCKKSLKLLGMDISILNNSKKVVFEIQLPQNALSSKLNT